MPFYRWLILLWIIPLSAVMLYQSIRGPGSRRWGIYNSGRLKHRLPVDGPYSRIFVGSIAGFMIVIATYLLLFGTI
jgi:hypothetical protein